MGKNTKKKPTVKTFREESKTHRKKACGHCGKSHDKIGKDGLCIRCRREFSNGIY